MSRIKYNVVVISQLAIFLIGVLATSIDDSTAATSQGTRTFAPEGFEFSVTTPVLKYHFPRENNKATVFKGTWIAENAEEIRPNYEIDSAEAQPGTQPVVFFNLNKPQGDWPKGLYRLEIRADGVLVRAVRFVIR
jgi:hypothetical protein